MPFRVTGLDPAPFRQLFGLSDADLAAHAARRVVADASPGFVWRLQTEAGDATSLQPYDDERIIVNLSVWQTPEHLKQFVYRSAHAEVMRQRKSWFERFGARPSMVQTRPSA